jgi:hypothetical protein
MANNASSIEGKWYDSGNVGEMHDDLRTHYGQVFRIISARPGLTKHFEQCAICRSIKEAHEGAVTQMVNARRRQRYELRPSDVAQLLGLPPGHEIVIMYATMEPNTIQIVVMGEDLDVVAEDVEAPKLRLVA